MFREYKKNPRVCRDEERLCIVQYKELVKIIRQLNENILFQNSAVIFF